MIQNINFEFIPHPKTKNRIASNPKRLKYYFNRSKAETNQQYFDRNIFYQQYTPRNEADRKSEPVARPQKLKVYSQSVAQSKIKGESKPKVYFRNAIMFNNDLNQLNGHVFLRNNTSFSPRIHQEPINKEQNQFFRFSINENSPKHQQQQNSKITHYNQNTAYSKRKHNLSAHNSHREINPFTKQQYLYLSVTNRKDKPFIINSKNQQFMKITKLDNKQSTLFSNRTTSIQQTSKKRPHTFQTTRTALKKADKQVIVSKKNVRDHLLEKKQDVTPWNIDFLNQFKTQQDELL